MIFKIFKLLLSIYKINVLIYYYGSLWIINQLEIDS